MGLDIKGKVTSMEFYKYDPTAYKRSPITKIRGKKVLGKVRETFTTDLGKTEFYSEDPEAPRFLVVLHLDENKSINLKVVDNFVITNEHFYYSPSKLPWRVLEDLSRKRSLLRGIRKEGKWEKVHFEEKPCFK